MHWSRRFIGERVSVHGPRSRPTAALAAAVAVVAALVLAPSAAQAAVGVATTTTVTVNPATADAGNEGGSIQWTINVVAADNSTVTGTGTWTLSGPGGPIATNSFSPSAANLTISASGLSAGTYTLSASYGGDATYLASSGSADGVFAQVATTTTVAVNPATVDAGAEGGSLQWTINVTRNTGTGPVHGTGTWTLSGPGGPIATNSFDASVANLTISASGLSAGTYTLSASYAGDTTFLASSGSADGVFAQVATTTTVTVNPATADAGNEGGSLQWTINVTRNSGTGPVHGTGTYTLSGPGGPIATNSFDASVANLTISASGLSAGTYTLSASYAGDTTFLPSSGSADGVFAKVATTTTVTASPSTAPAGTGSIQWTVNVTRDTGTGPVHGTGTWTLSGPGGPIATNAFDASVANLTISASGLSAGTYTLSASYGGDTTFLASSGSADASFVANSAVTLVSSLNPSVSGQAVTFTATVSGSGGTPTGSVTFKDGSTTIATVSLDSNGVASTTTSALGIGNHTITAFYSGDSTFTSVTSSGLVQSVAAPAPPTTTATVSPVPNGAGWNNSPVSVTLVATPSAGGLPVAATYYAVDDATCTPAATTTCHTYSAPVALTSDGVHTITFFSVDTFGTAEALQSIVVRLDQVAPTTTATPSSPPNTAGWYTGPVSVTFTASDATSNVDHTEASLDGAPFTPVSGSMTISTDGVHTLAYRSVDRAGNVETAKTMTLKVDATAPTLKITVSPGAAPAWKHPVTATGTATFFARNGAKVATTSATCVNTTGLRLNLVGSDTTSGVATIGYSASGAQSIAAAQVPGSTAVVPISSRGLTMFRGFDTDRAGNSSAPQRWAVLVGGWPATVEHPGSCAMPLGSRTLPAHGRVVVVGRIKQSPTRTIAFEVEFRY